MDIVRFKGRLGNQMFQYAFMEALKYRGRKVYASLGYYDRLDTTGSFILQDVFPEINDIDVVDDEVFQKIDKKWKEIKNNSSKLEDFKNNIEERFFFVEEEDGVFDEKIFQTINCTFVGYWQTEKYFNNIKKDLKNKFAFRISDHKLLEFSDKLQKDFFSIHIRKGDYLKKYFKEIYGGICTKQYYQAAIEYIKFRLPHARFIIFSDEIEKLSTEILQTEYITVFDRSIFENYQDWYDMYLMSRCRGNIIANSSFSWWGAWLNNTPDKIVISPKTWLNGCRTPDVWCESWIKL